MQKETETEETKDILCLVAFQLRDAQARCLSSTGYACGMNSFTDFSQSLRTKLSNACLSN